MGPRTIASRYAGIVLDVDGVLIRGATAIPGAPETVARLRRDGHRFVFATNNASRTPAQVAAHLVAAGVEARAEEVVTSALAATRLLEPGTRCLIIGMRGLREPLHAHGCIEVHDPAQAAVVVVGLDTDLSYARLTDAALALGRGARFIGTNPDTSFPSERGLLPGNGAILAALTAATGVEPEIAGKPARALFEAAAALLPAGALLMVGDRLDTDIAGGQDAGWDTALVRTGVSRDEAIAAAGPVPTYVLDDVSGLLDLP